MIQSLLAIWKNSFLFLGVHLILVNSVTSTFLIYLVFFYLLPEWVLERIVVSVDLFSGRVP